MSVIVAETRVFESAKGINHFAFLDKTKGLLDSPSIQKDALSTSRKHPETIERRRLFRRYLGGTAQASL